MTPAQKNRQVECILSLIVIVYALRLIILNIETVILYLPQLLWAWLEYGETPRQFFDLQFWSNIGLVLAQVAIGSLLIFFFPRVVQWIGYFATKRKLRSKRRWFSWEILAIPLILFAYIQFLGSLFQIISIISLIPTVIYADDYLDYLGYNLGMIFIGLVYLGFAVVVLFNARYIAVWLLRISRASPGIAKNSTIK